jgi:DnaJ-domain-containing protein 1
VGTYKNMTDYSLTTRKTFLETRRDIANEMRLWEITDYLIEQKGTTAKVTYMKNGKTVELVMEKQYRAQDNLRVLFLAIHSMRMNEVRGIGGVIESAYIQLNAPVLEKDPYDVLGLPRGTATSVCEAQYRELSKQYHPDSGGSPEKFKELKEAIEKIRAAK